MTGSLELGPEHVRVLDDTVVHERERAGAVAVRVRVTLGPRPVGPPPSGWPRRTDRSVPYRSGPRGAATSRRPGYRLHNACRACKLLEHLVARAAWHFKFEAPSRVAWTARG